MWQLPSPSSLGQLRPNQCWKYGVPPVGNANFAWVQHFIHHLAPNGVAGFVLANGSMSSTTSGEGEIRKRIVEADLVECMVALPGQLFYTTQIPVCLWFLARKKTRPLHTLFIDARKLGRLTDRVHRELTEEDLSRIFGTYHAWRGDPGAEQLYADVPGFCKSTSVERSVNTASFSLQDATLALKLPTKTRKRLKTSYNGLSARWTRPSLSQHG